MVAPGERILDPLNQLILNPSQLNATQPACVSQVGSEGRTALMVAAEFGHTAVVRELAAHGAALDATEPSDGATALLAAGVEVTRHTALLLAVTCIRELHSNYLAILPSLLPYAVSGRLLNLVRTRYRTV